MGRSKTREAGSQWHMAEVRTTQHSKLQSPRPRRQRRVCLGLLERVVELSLEIGLALLNLIGDVLSPVDVAKRRLNARVGNIRNGIVHGRRRRTRSSDRNKSDNGDGLTNTHLSASACRRRYLKPLGENLHRQRPSIPHVVGNSEHDAPSGFDSRR